MLASPLALLLLLLPAQAPESTATQDTIFYGGRLVRFLARTEQVVLLDSAWVRYREMTVYSDSIHYDTKTRRLAAFGDVLFVSGEQNITGAHLTYDLDTRKGMMRTARTVLDNGYFRADEVWLVEEKVLNARRAHYTTCDREHSHYSFYGPRTKLLMDDIAIAEPVVFRLFNVPLLAAPFWLVPVASKRTSGIMPFKVGNAADQGWYAKNLAYYWVINDYADATFYCDVMTKKGIQPRFEAVYIVNPFARGSVQGSYIQEWDTQLRRYSLNATDSSRFFFDTELKVLADYQSDASYAPEYGEEQLDWLKQEVFSHAELSRRILGVGTVSARAEHRNEFARRRRQSYLPSARISFGTRRLPLDWTASPALSFANLIRAWSDSLGSDTLQLDDRSGRAAVGLSSPQYSLGPAGELTVSSSFGLLEQQVLRNSMLDNHTRSLGTGLRLETAQRPLGLFNLYENVSFDRTDNLVDTVAPAPRYATAISGNMSLFRVYSLEDLGLEGMLHTARPGLGISYEPEVEGNGFFGRVRPLSPAVASANFTLANSFEAKFRRRAADLPDTVPGEIIKLDLGRLNFSSAYDLLEKHLSPLRADASLKPLQTVAGLDLNLYGNASYDFDSLALGKDYALSTVLNWNHDFTRAKKPQSLPDSAIAAEGAVPDSAPGLQPAPSWKVQLALNHTFARERNMLTGSVGLNVPGWAFTLNSLGYNFAQRQLTDYSFTIWKDLHCWEALVNLNRLGAQWRYDFEFRIKRLPDVKFGKSTFRGFLPE